MHKKPCLNSCSQTDSHSPQATGLLLAGTLLLASSPLQADTDWREACTAPLFTPLNVDQSLTVGEQTNIAADRTFTDTDGMAVFEGDVVISRGNSTAKSDRAVYDSKQQRFDLDSNIRLQTERLQVIAERGVFNMESDTGEFSGVSFQLDARPLSAA